MDVERIQKINALALELMKLRADLVPYVSSREQKEIEKKYGKPSRKTEKSVEIEL